MTLAQAIERCGVPRPSAYRVFSGGDSSPQDAFVLAVIEAIVSETTIADRELIETQTVPLVHEAHARADHADSVEMGLRLRELVRVFGNAIFDSAAADPYTPIFHAAQIAGLGEAADSPLVIALENVGNQARDDFIAGFRSIAEVFGCRLHNDWTWEAFGAAAGNPVTGCLINRKAPGNVELELPTGPDKELQRWSTFALCVWSVVLLSWVPNPRVRNAAALPKS